MKNQYTPGPWIVKGGNVIENEAGVNIAKTWMTDREEECANARLISASPDLLSALQLLESRMTKAARAFYEGGKASMLRDAFSGWRDEIEQARAAIAKAEGVA